MRDDASEANSRPLPSARVDYGDRASNPCRGSAEREAVHLHARFAELDLEAAGDNRSWLADQLVRALVAGDAAAVGVHVGPVGAVRGLTVEEDPEWDRSSPGRRSHDEVEVARVELEGDASAGLVRHRGVL